MPVIGRHQILWMSLAIHEDGPDAMRASDIEDVHTLGFRTTHEFIAIGRQELPRPTRRFAASVRLQLIFTAVVVHLFCPGLKRHIANIQLSGKTGGSSNRKLHLDRIARFELDETLGASGTWKPHPGFARQRAKT